MRIHQPKKIEHSECQTCDKTFDTRKALTDHNWRHHKSDHTCQQCGIVFPTQGQSLKISLFTGPIRRINGKIQIIC